MVQKKILIALTHIKQNILHMVKKMIAQILHLTSQFPNFTVTDSSARLVSVLDPPGDPSFHHITQTHVVHIPAVMKSFSPRGQTMPFTTPCLDTGNHTNTETWCQHLHQSSTPKQVDQQPTAGKVGTTRLGTNKLYISCLTISTN